MEIAATDALPEGSDAAIRVYRCNGCHREMRLTVWASFSPPLTGHEYCQERALSAGRSLGWLNAVQQRWRRIASQCVLRR